MPGYVLQKNLCFFFFLPQFKATQTYILFNLLNKGRNIIPDTIIFILVSDALLLRIDPNRQQHFEYHTVSFHCEGGDGSSQLRRVRSSEEINPECQNKRTSTGFVCTISNIYIADSGEYWCKTKGGQISNSVNITVTAGSVILDSPALPVSEGDALTLSCKDKTTTPHLSAVFYRDDVKKESSSTGELIINSANKSHEGLYKCIIPGAGESPESLLAVRGKSLHYLISK
uniref:Ig-like domain-containing protein n=1 Tax=Sparus aurata TaxID=8175 RepID=A0A671TNF3_SPAAU